MGQRRHGFEDVTLAGIQDAVKSDGALFQVNHPTIFPGPLFSNFCRGCAFQEAELTIDWDQVDTIEVLTGPVLVSTETSAYRCAGHDPEPVHPARHRPVGAKAARRPPHHGGERFGLQGRRDRARREQAGLGSSATAVYAETCPGRR